MTEMPRFGLKDIVALVLVLAVAGGVRYGYLATMADNANGPGPWAVQDPWPDATPAGERAADKERRNELDALVEMLKKEGRFAYRAPLADKDEVTAHIAPGYPWFVAQLSQLLVDPFPAVRWIQAALGALAAGLYFLFARRAFRSWLVGLLAGLGCALHPYWVINTAELNDGVVTSFLLALCLWLGARGTQEGAPFSSLLYGLGLAGLALVRATLLPFALVAEIWFLFRCRLTPRGWLCSLLAFLGFANGVALWSVRNYQVYHDVVPVADSLFYHLWMGNNPQATGGPLDEAMLRNALPDAKQKALADEPNQNKRYGKLAQDVLNEVESNAYGTLQRRLSATGYFFFGQSWDQKGILAYELGGAEPSLAGLPEVVRDWVSDINSCLLGSLVAMLALGFLGWRWTYGWCKTAMPASLAVLWIPLPYILSHAEMLSGPRLPLDGVLLTFAAFAVCCFIPGVGGFLLRGDAANAARELTT
jgi:hypothetical protein